MPGPQDACSTQPHRGHPQLQARRQEVLARLAVEDTEGDHAGDVGLEQPDLEVAVARLGRAVQLDAQALVAVDLDDLSAAGGLGVDKGRELSARHDLSTVALSSEGEVLAYVLCGEWVDRELYVNIVGTVPSARGRGLAADALRRTISLAAATGEFDLIGLDVDSESLTGATRLYERVGFVLKHQTMAMQRDLPLR